MGGRKRIQGKKGHRFALSTPSHVRELNKLPGRRADAGNGMQSVPNPSQQGSATSATSADDRRGEPRISCHKHIQIIPASCLREWKAFPAELNDAAGQGVGIIFDRPMQVGEQFIIRLQFDDGARLLLYTVKHSQWLSMRRYQIGAEFSGCLAVPCRLDAGAILGALLALET
jgi:hypothetical protein